MKLFSDLLRGPAAVPPPPPGVVVEPLDAEGLVAVARRLSHEPDAQEAFYKGHGWTISGTGVVSDEYDDERCVGISRYLYHAVRVATVPDEQRWWQLRVINIPAVSVLAVAAALATDPAYVDEIAGQC